MASNPPDWWGPVPKARPSGGRVVRLCKDDEEGEAIMPKGVYERKPRGDDAPAANDAPAQPRKRGRKARALAVVPEAAAARVNGSKDRFDVSLDLRGGAVTINAMVVVFRDAQLQ